MSDSEKIHTYRSGQKAALRKRPDKMVVVLHDRVKDSAVIASEKVSSGSTPVMTDGVGEATR